jgi:hypothetical protein
MEYAMKSTQRFVAGAAVVLALLLVARSGDAAEAGKTENVLFVMTDGLRWQEVFGGADESLMSKEAGGVADLAATKRAFWRDTPEARREALMPFVWTVMAKQGQVFGNRTKGSNVQVTNGHKFSYPGYSETFCGFADPRVDRNDLGPNPNVTVLEWLNGKSAFRGRVAAFGAWNTFNDILNRQRCGFYVNAGYAPMIEGTVSPQVELLNQLKADVPHKWGGEPFDALMFYTAMEYFKAQKPRIFFVGLGETDEWGHEGRYDEYLIAARRADRYVQMLWETAQSQSQYAGKTTLVFLADHGRGVGPAWKDHGKDIAGAEETWLAVLGPDTPALGERANAVVDQNQVAATLAALLGEDYCAEVPQAGKPVAEVLKSGR